MRVNASITVSMEIDGTEDPIDVHDDIIQSLIAVCDGWLNGDTIPTIRISYSLEKEDIDASSPSLN